MRVIPFLFALVACGGPAETPTTEAPAAAAQAPQVEEAPRAEIPDTPAGQALASYEDLRVELVHDRLDGAKEAASTLATRAGAAAEADEAHAELLQALQAAATKGAEADDLDAARAAYSEISQAIVGLQIADESLREGWEIYHCPMVDGFQKWTQPVADLQNPYMGQRMLKCGGVSEWTL